MASSAATLAHDTSSNNSECSQEFRRLAIDALAGKLESSEKDATFQARAAEPAMMGQAMRAIHERRYGFFM